MGALRRALTLLPRRIYSNYAAFASPATARRIRERQCMAKSKSKSTSNLTAFAVVLCILIVASFALYRYFKTEHGQVFLLDAGVGGRYEIVQRNMERRIVRVLKRHGVRSDRIVTTTEEQARSARATSVIHAETPPDASLVQINLAIVRAARAMGCRVISCREGKDGTIITMEIGTRRALTHKCVIKRGSERQHQARRAEPLAPAVAVCVDDFGFFDNTLVEEFLALDVPLTISVIPGLKHSERIARKAAEAGKDVLCHLPMEAEKEGWDSGEIPLIRTSMKAKEIEAAVVKALDTTPGAIGMNNHMGSRATADRALMRAVLQVCKTRGLFFFDSVTTPHSVARDVAREMGVAEAGNDLFADAVPAETRDNMQKLISIAARRGSAIGIVHVKKETLEDLRWMIDAAREEGVDFLTISEMIHRRALAAAEGGRI